MRKNKESTYKKKLNKYTQKIILSIYKKNNLILLHYDTKST